MRNERFQLAPLDARFGCTLGHRCGVVEGKEEMNDWSESLEEARKFTARLQQMSKEIQAVQAEPISSPDLIECVRRLLHGTPLTEREADEIHAIVRQNTVRKRL